LHNKHSFTQKKETGFIPVSSPFEVKLVELFVVAGTLGIARTLERHSIRRLRNALLLRLLRLGRGRIGGFAGVAGLGTAD
jgi:hypothetical protein